MEVGIDSVSAADRPGLALGCNHAAITHDYVSWLLPDTRAVVCGSDCGHCASRWNQGSKFFVISIPAAAV